MRSPRKRKENRRRIRKRKKRKKKQRSLCHQLISPNCHPKGRSKSYVKCTSILRRRSRPNSSTRKTRRTSRRPTSR